MPVKQNASFDASFWINTCNAGLIGFLFDYFRLFVCQVVVDEIRYPITHLGIEAACPSRLDEHIRSGQIVVQNPQQSVDWFQAGENAAVGLAIERGYVLLVDDANPFHFAKSKGLKVIGTLDLLVFLHDQNRLNYADAAAAIGRVRASKKQLRQAGIALELLARETSAERSRSEGEKTNETK